MTRSTKSVLVLAAICSGFAGSGPTQTATCGQNGSPTNDARSCETSSGELKCGDGGATPPPFGPELAIGTEPVVEVCNEHGRVVPWEGRVGVDSDCDCVYLDGGSSNDAPIDGWLRIDSGGVRCGPANGGHSYNSGGGTLEDCALAADQAVISRMGNM